MNRATNHISLNSVRNSILSRDYDRIIAEIHGFIKNTIYEMKEKLTQSLISFDIALETCLKEAQKRGAQEYLFLGDYLGELA